MLVKLTHRAMWLFAILTALPTAAVIIWAMFYGFYYVFTMSEFNMDPYNGDYVAAAWVSFTLTFAVLWASFFGLRVLADNRQTRIDKIEREERYRNIRGY